MCIEPEVVMTRIPLYNTSLPSTATFPLDTHHLELLSKPDTDDMFPEWGIMGIDLVCHLVLR